MVARHSAGPASGADGRSPTRRQPAASSATMWRTSGRSSPRLTRRLLRATESGAGALAAVAYPIAPTTYTNRHDASIVRPRGSYDRHDASIVRPRGSYDRHGASIVRHDASIVRHGASIVRLRGLYVRHHASIVRLRGLYDRPAASIVRHGGLYGTSHLADLQDQRRIVATAQSCDRQRWPTR